LLAIADRIEENSDLFVRLESVDAGKPLMVSRDDVGPSSLGADPSWAHGSQSILTST
jgi:hypothetical protein